MKLQTNKTSLNQKALRRITITAVLSGLLLIALFYVVEMVHIRERAHLALKEKLYFQVGPSGERIPETYYAYTGDLTDDDGLLSDIEREMLEYYVAHQAELPRGEIHRFYSKGAKVYFMPLAASRVDEDTYNLSGDILLYTDVSFATELTSTATSILVLALAGIALLLFWIERKTVRMLDAKDSDMKHFFANASHELKTPLMAIRGYADGLDSNLVEQKKACAVIIKEADRMTSLVNAILELSKLDSGTVQPHMAENDVREILYDAIQVIEQTAQQKGIEIVPDLPAPLLFTCDEDMLFSAFSNILTNCVRYAKSRITLTASQQKSSPALSVCISNDGQCISEQDAAHLFERFYKGAGGQTGVGMALSQEYVKLHHGRIGVQSNSKGTVFEVVL